MDFIEQIFGISPDGGTGWFEFLLFAVPLAGIVYLGWRKRRAAAAKRSQSRREP